MNPLAVMVGLLISTIVGVIGFEFMLPEIHGAQLQGFEGQIQSLTQAAGEYAEENGSYSGISCRAMVAKNLWPAGGCTPAGTVTTSGPGIGTLSIGPVSGSPSEYQVVAVTNGYYTPSDLSMVCARFAPWLDQPCSVSGTTITFIF
ncbi:MAG: hypothetical protein ACYDBP_04355 [Leptospirales bacterium]